MDLSKTKFPKINHDISKLSKRSHIFSEEKKILDKDQMELSLPLDSVKHLNYVFQHLFRNTKNHVFPLFKQDGYGNLLQSLTKKQKQKRTNRNRK